MSLIAVFKDREVTPIRAIPFVTGGGMPPDMLASVLANTSLWSRLKDLTAYHIMTNGEHAPMLPKEWDIIEAELDILSSKLKAIEKNDQENFPKWYRESISILPARCFVWKDEFEITYKQTHSHELTIVNERFGDRELNFSPRVPDELINIVMEGFLIVDVDKNLNAPVIDSTERKAIGRRNQQLTTIFTIITTLGFDPLNIPSGGKSKIKEASLQQDQLFTSAGFDHAWKEGLSQEMFRLEDHNKYSNKKTGA